MRKSYKFKKKIRHEKRFLYNYKIKAPAVLVIDEEGQSLGVMPTGKAVALALDKGFDLVEVTPIANPPVAKIMDYGSFKYQKEKQLKKQRLMSKSMEVKSVRLSAKIGEHDKQVRLKQAHKFLEKGHNIKVEIILKGREMHFADAAKQALHDFKNSLAFPVQIEQDISKQGNKFFMILMPDKAAILSEQKERLANNDNQ